jgi:WD40 repeat protein
MLNPRKYVEMTIEKRMEYSVPLGGNKPRRVRKWASNTNMMRNITGNIGSTTTPTKPSSSVKNVSWSSNSEFLLVAHGGDSSNSKVTLYRIFGEIFQRVYLSITDVVNHVCIAPDAKYLSIATNSASGNSVSVVMRNEDDATRMNTSEWSSLPTVTAYNTSWSPNGEVIAVGTPLSPYLWLGQRRAAAGGLFKMPNPSTMPTGTVNHTAWSPDAKYLAVCSNASPYLMVYARTGNYTWSNVVLNGGVVSSAPHLKAGWSPDGKYLVVCTNGGSNFSLGMYKVEGNSLTRLAFAIPPAFPTQVRSVVWHPGGEYFAVVSGSHFISMYKFDYKEDKAYPVAFPLPLLAQVEDVSWSPDGRFFIVCYQDTNHLDIFAVDEDTSTGARLIIQN